MVTSYEFSSTVEILTPAVRYSMKLNHGKTGASREDTNQTAFRVMQEVIRTSESDQEG